VKRLELVGVRLCERCGRGGAELRSEDGETLVVPLDPVNARALSGAECDLRSLADLLVERLPAAGVEASEVVLDVAEERLRALFSFAREGEEDVVACAAGEGVALAVRGGLKLYATDEALAHAAQRAGRPHRHGGTGGSDVLH